MENPPLLISTLLTKSFIIELSCWENVGDQKSHLKALIVKRQMKLINTKTETLLFRKKFIKILGELSLNRRLLMFIVTNKFIKCKKDLLPSTKSDRFLVN